MYRPVLFKNMIDQTYRPIVPLRIGEIWTFVFAPRELALRLGVVYRPGTARNMVDQTHYVYRLVLARNIADQTHYAYRSVLVRNMADQTHYAYRPVLARNMAGQIHRPIVLLRIGEIRTSAFASRELVSRLGGYVPS